MDELEARIDLFLEDRYEDRPCCPYCGEMHHYEAEDLERGEELSLWECNKCGKEFAAAPSFTIDFYSYPLVQESEATND